MTRILTFMLAFILSATVVSANPISREEARQKAAAFLGEQQALAPIADGKRLSRQRRAAAKEESEYYVFNIGTRGGFVIVSGDDRTEPILGYTDTGTFDYETLPPALQDMLEHYTTQIARLQQMPETEWAARSSQRRAATVPTHPKVAQLMTCTWNQRGPYNNLCPKDNDGNRSVTGCVATAMAQILYYHRDKMVTETQAPIPGYTSWSHQLKVDGIPEGSPLDWDYMVDNGGSSAKQQTAVAQLMLYCGVSVKMDYTSGSSGAQISEVPIAMINYFGMGSTAHHVWKDDMSDVDWDVMVYDELAAGRPVYMGGYTGDWGMGHAFVCDGYDGNRRYHINWGWGGNSDGYYLLTNLTPGQQGAGGNDNGQGYSTGPNIVIGIEPVNYATRALAFSDATVRDICRSHFDADGDGKVTYGEAAEVTDLGTAFKGQSIRTFPELYYFTALETITDDAFNGCAALQSLRLPKRLKGIGARAFSGCAKLTSLTLPTGVKTIGAEAFSGCKLLYGFSLPEGLKAIESGTFRDCAKLDEVTLPIGMQSIGDGAFSNCTGLKTVAVKTFAPTMLKMGNDVFSGCQLADATLSVMQSTEEWFAKADQWCDFGTLVVERELSGGRFDALEDGQTYYLYHVGTGQYMTRGEAYGTQAVVGTEPMRFEAHHPSTQAEGIYYLKNDDSSLAYKILFRTNTDSNVGNGVKACFVDGKSSNSKSYWKIQAVDNSAYGDNVYTIQMPSTESGYDKDCYLGIQPDHESGAAEPTYGAYYDVKMSDDEAACLWRFVKYSPEQTQEYKTADQLANLLTLARKMGITAKVERAIYDDIKSPAADIRRAQQSLRRRMNYVDFADVTGQQTFVDLGDINSDGELSRSEAAVMKDLDVKFINDETVTDMDAMQYFTSTTILRTNMFYGCKKLTSVTLPPNIKNIGAGCFQNCTALQQVTLTVADPAAIEVDKTSFSNANQANCTLRVPQGSEGQYRQAAVWKDFGHIVGIRLDEQGKALEQLLTTAAEADIDTKAEQAVYDDATSSETDISAAIDALRRKLHYIDMADKKAQNICLVNWDTSLDGELSLEEAAAVETIGELFRNISGLETVDMLRYFTGLTEIPSSAFRGSTSLRTVYVPAGVTSIGEFAFTGCNDLKYLVLMNGETMITQGMMGLPQQGMTLFVPASVIGAYQADEAWSTRCSITEFTDKPVVSAEASRQYGIATATISMIVSGAPVIGEAAFDCAENDDLTTPVGTYPIIVRRGTITDNAVELHEGVLTIEPASVRVTAKSYTRNVGEANPEFTVTYMRFRNKENASVLTRQPDITCEATIDSPAGEYPINVSGAEAQNYVFTYVSGTLTVIDTNPVGAIKGDSGRPDVVYDLQGRRVKTPQRGLYIIDRKKVFVR